SAKSRPDAPSDARPEPQRATHHHPLLLRRHDDEGDRRDARPERITRQPDALQHRGPVAAATGQAADRVQQLNLFPDCGVATIPATPQAACYASSSSFFATTFSNGRPASNRLTFSTASGPINSG